MATNSKPHPFADVSVAVYRVIAPWANFDGGAAKQLVAAMLAVPCRAAVDRVAVVADNGVLGRFQVRAALITVFCYKRVGGAALFAYVEIVGIVHIKSSHRRQSA